DFHVTGVQTCALPICGAHELPGDDPALFGLRQGRAKPDEVDGETPRAGHHPYRRHRSNPSSIIRPPWPHRIRSSTGDSSGTPNEEPTSTAAWISGASRGTARTLW